ncbi:MAG: 1-acyl-sn-glycerol-3-phosphate acyltransferase [Pirellulaceae bacterium]
MQEIIIAKPYEFIPPHRGNLAPTLIQSFRIVDWYLRKYEGVVSHEVRGIDHLKESLRAGHGIVLAPNHCRYADPIAMGWLARKAGTHVFAMASWHLFNQGWLQAFAMRMCGGFSVYREGIDRQSLETAVDILAQASRPLVVFPEGTVFRTNDIVQPLLDGVAFLARSAARRREKQSHGKVVIHPIAIKYLFRGDVQSSVEPIVTDLENRFSWQSTGPRGDLIARVTRLEAALLALKEIQHLGSPQMGSLSERRAGLISHLLGTTEEKWLGRIQSDQKMIPRIKQLRVKMVPKLIDPHTSQTDINAIWADLAKLYLAQQIGSYPAGYLDQPTDTRLLETVERLDEDITDRARIHRPLHAILQVDQPIEVDCEKPPRGVEDPVMTELQLRLETMLAPLASEACPL